MRSHITGHYSAAQHLATDSLA